MLIMFYYLNFLCDFIFQYSWYLYWNVLQWISLVDQKLIFQGFFFLGNESKVAYYGRKERHHHAVKHMTSASLQETSKNFLNNSCRTTALQK
jgi:hypothetical protein